MTSLQTAVPELRPVIFPANGPIKVFTYGTLRPSLYPGAVKRFGLTEVGPAVLYGPFQMINLGRFPGLVITPSEAQEIKGEVVEVASLEHLDRYEGHQPGRANNLYDRQVVRVRMNDGVELDAWVYTFGATQAPHPVRVVMSNDWATEIGV